MPRHLALNLSLANVQDGDTLVKRNNNEARSFGTMASIHRLIILSDFPRISASGNKNSCTTRDQSLKNLCSNTSRTGASDENILILERNTIFRSLFQTFQIQSSQTLIVFPSIFLFLFQMQE